MRILVATDGSNDAKAAVEWLHHLPLPGDRDVMVITVLTPSLVTTVPRLAGELHAARIADGRRLADDTASELLCRTAIGRVVEGDPREEIVAAARDWGADLLVMGARGLGAIKGFLLGSVSLWVARHAPCPVLVCKGTPRTVHAITVGVDGSDHACRALDWLASFPLAPSTRVRLVAAAAPQRYSSERCTALEAAVRDCARTLAERTTVAVEVVSGAPADVLVQDAERHGSDLVVVGARGAGALTRLLLGSVSETVLRHAGCPVLVVRARDPIPEARGAAR